MVSEDSDAKSLQKNRSARSSARTRIPERQVISRRVCACTNAMMHDFISAISPVHPHFAHVAYTDPPGRPMLTSFTLTEPANSRSTARQKLTRLTRQQFQELSTDVYDELMRRKNNSNSDTEGMSILTVVLTRANVRPSAFPSRARRLPSEAQPGTAEARDATHRQVQGPVQ